MLVRNFLIAVLVELHAGVIRLRRRPRNPDHRSAPLRATPPRTASSVLLPGSRTSAATLAGTASRSRKPQLSDTYGPVKRGRYGTVPARAPRPHHRRLPRPRRQPPRRRHGAVRVPDCRARRTLTALGMHGRGRRRPGRADPRNQGRRRSAEEVHPRDRAGLREAVQDVARRARARAASRSCSAAITAWRRDRSRRRRTSRGAKASRSGSSGSTRTAT